MMNLKVRKVLFWDLDFDKLDTEKHKLHIIQQVLNLGNIDEFNAVLDHYGFDEVKDAVQNI
jgi:antitoxin HigA-1